MGNRDVKVELLDFIQKAAVESTKTPSLVVTTDILKKLEIYKNIDKISYLQSILKEV